MAKQPDDLVLRILREIQATLSVHGRMHEEHRQAFERLEKQLADLSLVVTYSLGQSTETRFRQSQQQQQIDELFDKLEKLLSDEQPV